MKKSIIMLVTVASFATLALQSCKSNTEEEAMMQKPLTEQASVGNEIASVSTSEAKVATTKNLLDAYKGETTASAKYLAYSKKAEEEGFHEIAILFATASKSEKIHANNHKAVLEESGQIVATITPEFTVQSTKDNLQDAIKGEGYEISTMYPEFLTTAKKAENQLAQVSFNYAYKTEQKHKVFYEKALAALKSNSVKTLPTVYYICPTCGNTYDTTAPKRCGISMTSAEKFIKIVNLTT
jgi:rubrerythrin